MHTVLILMIVFLVYFGCMPIITYFMFRYWDVSEYKWEHDFDGEYLPIYIFWPIVVPFAVPIKIISNLSKIAKQAAEKHKQNTKKYEKETLICDKCKGPYR